MFTPTPPEVAEQVILSYMELLYLRNRGKLAKIFYFLEPKLRELGVSRRQAGYLIQFARRIGMIHDV